MLDQQEATRISEVLAFAAGGYRYLKKLDVDRPFVADWR